MMTERFAAAIVVTVFYGVGYVVAPALAMWRGPSGAIVLVSGLALSPILGVIVAARNTSVVAEWTDWSCAIVSAHIGFAAGWLIMMALFRWPTVNADRATRNVAVVALFATILIVTFCGVVAMGSKYMMRVLGVVASIALAGLAWSYVSPGSSQWTLTRFALGNVTEPTFHIGVATALMLTVPLVFVLCKSALKSRLK